jgi:hypothetical protein
MGKQLIAIIAVGSVLGSEAVSEIDTRGLHWMAAPDPNHTEIPEGVARGAGPPSFTHNGQHI